MITAATLRRIAAMPVEAMTEALLFLAEQLEVQEAKLALQRTRQKRYRDAHHDVTTTSLQRHCDDSVTSLARVEDNILPSFTSGKEDLESKITPLKSPPKPSKPLPSEPEGFVEFMEVYPRRDHSFDRKRTLAGYLPALKRASHETIMEGLHHYAQAMIERGQVGTAFVALPRTWLNQDRWKIQYSTPTKGLTTHGYVMRDSVEQACEFIDRREQESGENGGQDDTRLLPRLRQGTP